MEKRRNNQRDKERKSREGALGYKLLSFVTPRLLTYALVFPSKHLLFPAGAKGS